MNRLILFFVLFFPSATISLAQVPAPDNAYLAIDRDDFVWNKWDTENFIVLSIDKSQGVYLKNNIEALKSNFENKWKVKKEKLAVPCKLVCVPDSSILERFFNINSPHSEARRDSSGNVSLFAIWIEMAREKDLPQFVANICLENLNSAAFVQRGITRLEKANIKSDFSTSFDLNVKKVLNTTRSDWYSLSPEEKESFDRSSALICFMLRKELGIDKFSRFLSSKQDEESLRSVYGFKDVDSFSSTARRYLDNLSKDIESKVAPDEYFILK